MRFKSEISFFKFLCRNMYRAQVEILPLHYASVSLTVQFVVVVVVGFSYCLLQYLPI